MSAIDYGEFAAAVRKCGSVRQACMLLGIPRQKYYTWSKAQPAFAKSIRQICRELRSESIEQIAQLYAGGAKLREIVAHTGRSKMFVTQTVRARGLRRNRTASRATVRAIAEKRAAGASVPKLAAEYGRSDFWIRSRLREHEELTA